MTEIDYLLTGATVVTANENWEVFSPGAVAVSGDSIVGVGPAEAIAVEYSSTETVDCSGKALIPGLVNAHTHVPMTLLRGLADVRVPAWCLVVSYWIIGLPIGAWWAVDRGMGPAGIWWGLVLALGLTSVAFCGRLAWLQQRGVARV